MKLSHLAPAALFALAAAPSLFAFDIAQNPEFPQTKSVAKKAKAAQAKATKAQVSETLNQIDDLVTFGFPIVSALDALQAQVDSFPGSSSLRARMTSYIDDLLERTGQTFIDAQDAANLRQRFVNARLDSALSRLERRARGGGWTAQQFTAVLSSWTARADVFVDAPDPQQYRARVMAAIATAAKDAKTVTDVMRDLQMMLLQVRLEEARQVLLRRVAASNVSRADYNRVHALLAKRAAFIQAASFPG